MAPDFAAPELRASVRAYLLGVLDAARAERLEARYVADPLLVDAMRDEEDALVADYLADRLTAVDRTRFDDHYLSSPVHRDRVALARALADRVAADAPTPSVSQAFYGWLAMAAAVVLASLWIVSRGGAPPQQVQTPAAPSPIPAPSTAPPTPAPRPVPAPDPGPALSPARAVFAITLSPIVPRGASAQPVHRTPGGAVDLDLRLEGTPEPGASGYDVELQTVDGRAVWRGRARAGSSPEGLLATVRIPLETVPADDYVVVVTSRGGNDRGRYVLRLRRR